MPHFWHFMYRVSPLTYLMRGMLSVAVHGKPITCHPDEINQIPTPPDNQTCGAFLSDWVLAQGGVLLNPDIRGVCNWCPMESTDKYLSFFNMFYSNRWHDLGTTIVYIVFNWAATFALYWAVRVPNKPKKKRVKVMGEKTTI
jgi:ATP-binding cassette subfamily G (WHITE) protein 2 (PDR)